MSNEEMVNKLKELGIYSSTVQTFNAIKQNKSAVPRYLREDLCRSYNDLGFTHLKPNDMGCAGCSRQVFKFFNNILG